MKIDQYLPLMFSSITGPCLGVFVGSKGAEGGGVSRNGFDGLDSFDERIEKKWRG